MKNLLVFTTLLALISGSGVAQNDRWFKGNTHAHTNRSDGNEWPRRVVHWYLDHEYNFLVVTDHNWLTDITYLDTDKADDFVVIPGEEVTEYFGKKPAHLCAINVKHVVEPRGGSSVADILERNAAAIRQAGGLVQVNHPNWRWGFGSSEMVNLDSPLLLEVYNVNKENNNFPAGGKPGTEEIWDRLLTAGLRVFGVASDDTHDYLGDITGDQAGPGKGWVMVRADELSAAAITVSLSAGDFYASTGVELKDVRILDGAYALEIAPRNDAAYTTLFIGREGKVLKEEHGLQPRYAFNGNELYVRAKVLCSSGDIALTQPYFPPKK